MPDVRIGSVGCGREYRRGCNMRLISTGSQTDRAGMRLMEASGELLGFGNSANTTWGRKTSMPGRHEGQVDRLALAGAGTSGMDRTKKGVGTMLKQAQSKLSSVNAQKTYNFTGVRSGKGSVSKEDADLAKRTSVPPQPRLNRGTTTVGKKSGSGKPLTGVSDFNAAGHGVPMKRF